MAFHPRHRTPDGTGRPRRATRGWRRAAVSFGLAAALAPAPAIAQDREPANERASGSRAKGESNAVLFVYEFADFECSHCARFALEVFPRIDSAFIKTGKVRWIFVNLPLPTHQHAWIAHEAALCAGAVAGKFWAMHDRLFATQKDWGGAADPAAALARHAKELALPLDAWQECTRQDQVASLLLQDVIFAATSRVSGTPAFIVNNEQTVMGLKSFEEWRTLLDQMLRERVRRH
jgi:protein-disulfide isomerase